MKRLSVTVGACLVAMLCQVCIAQTAQKQIVPVHPAITKEEIAKIKNPPVKPVVSPERIKQIQQNYSLYRSLSYTDGIICNPGADDVCQNRVTIYMFQWTDANGTFCVGLIPKFVLFTGTGGGNAAKRIVWELKPLDPAVPISPAGSNFEFLGDGDQGILVFQNIGSGGNRQLKDGRRGSGPSNTDVDKFHMKNEHKLIGTAAYLPIVVHRVPRSGAPDEVGLCGTPDPLIENVP